MTIQSQRLISSCFDSLSQALYLLDSTGYCIIPEGGTRLELPAVNCLPFIHYSSGSYLFEMLDLIPVMYLAIDEKASGADDLLHLAQGMISCILQAEGGDTGKNMVLRQTLKQKFTENEIIANAHRCGIPLKQKRAVIAISTESSEKQNLYTVLSEVIPIGDEDCLLEMDSHFTVLIKSIDSEDEKTEMIQFTQAVDETLQQEMGMHVCIGIGSVRETLTLLHESYQEAKRAMEIGSLFHPSEHLFDYSSLILERFLFGTSRESSFYYQNLIFNRHTQRLLNDEMLHTIEVFFEKDLNLSDTSRQLFIHRNTLVYRLEKVQKATGLDLRHFPDAVTFKVLYELRHCSQDKTNKT